MATTPDPTLYMPLARCKSEPTARREWLPYAVAATLLSLLIVVLASLAFWLETERTRERAIVYTDGISQLMARSIAEAFAKADIQLQGAALYYTDEQARGALDAGRFNAWLARQRTLSRDIDELLVLDARGVVRYGSGNPEPLNLGDREFFNAVRAQQASSDGGGLIFAAVPPGAKGEPWELVLARRLANGDDSFAGVVFAKFPVDRISRIFSTVDVGNSGSIVLRTADMLPLARHPQGNASEDDGDGMPVVPKLREMVRAYPDGRSYQAYSADDRSEHQYTFRRVTGFPLYVTVGRASAEFSSGWQRNPGFMLVLCSLLIGLILWGTWRIYRLAQDRARQRGDSNAARVLEAAPVAMLLVAGDGTIRNANARATALLGYATEALRGKALAELVPERQLARLDSLRGQTLQQDAAPGLAAQSGELLAVDRGGREIPVQIALARIEINEQPALVAAIVDLSERKAAEQAMRELLQLQTAILEHSAYAIVATDPQGVITLFNKAAEAMSGYTAAEVVGQATPVLFHDPDELRRRAARHGQPVDDARLLAEVMSGDAGVDGEEVAYRRKDGSSFPASRSLSILRDAGGTITGYLAIIGDISEQRARDQAIKSAYARLKLAADAANIAIWEWRFADDSMHWDERMRAWYGVSEAEIAAGIDYRFWRSHLHPDDVAPTEAALTTCRAKDAPCATSFRIKQADGSVRHIQAFGVIEHDDNGQPLCMIGVNLDVTREHEYAATLQAAKEAAEVANRSKSEFLANMSHEIRTPMNAILGLTGLVLDSELNARQRDYLDKVQASASALLRLINDILDYSKVEAGRLHLEEAPFELAAVVRRVGDLFANRIAEKELAWQVTIDPRLPRYLVGDDLRFGQILINLVGNAVKFTEHGSVNLNLELAEESGDSVTLCGSVSDSGPGISTEQASRLFAAFTQADASISRRHGGTGLGLSITRRLVRLMGGDIRVDSALGAGSTFTFSVALRRLGEHELPPAAATPAASELAEQAAAIAGARILVVEDTLSHFVLTRALLNMMGLQVSAARNGHEALAALERERFDAILMDLQMPEMDGFEASRRLHAMLGDDCPPIIAVSASAMAEDRAASRSAGMVDHLAKPYRREELLAALLRWIPPRPAGAGAPENTAEIAVDRQQLAPLLDELGQLLNGNRLTAKRVNEEIDARLAGSPLAAAYRPVGEAVRKLRFPDAIGALTTFCSELPAD